MKRSLVLAAVVPVGLAAATQQSQFRASTDLVRLEVSVTDERGAIRGLKQDDFVVEDQGVRQSIQVVESADAPLDLVLVVPPLPSVDYIAADQTPRVSAALSAFLQQVEDRDRLAVLLAATPPTRLRPLASGRPAFGVDAFTGSSYAAVFDTIVAGLGEFVPTDRRRALVVVTNAADFRSTVSFDSLIEIEGRPGPTFVMIGTPVAVHEDVLTRAVREEPYGERPMGEVTAQLRGSVFPARLTQLARRTGGIAVNLGEGSPAQLMADTVAWLRHVYLISYKPPAGEGWHTVTVKVNRRGASVRTREGYLVPHKATLR